MRAVAARADVAQWWGGVAERLGPLLAHKGEMPLADLLGEVAQTLEAFCGEDIWGREDGRAPK